MRAPCCASIGDFVATGCADIDGFRLGTVREGGGRLRESVMGRGGGREGRREGGREGGRE